MSDRKDPVYDWIDEDPIVGWLSALLVDVEPWFADAIEALIYRRTNEIMRELQGTSEGSDV